MVERKVHENDFKERFGVFLNGKLESRHEDGSVTNIEAYEVVVDPVNRGERGSILQEFVLRAAAAGYKQVMGPIVLNDVGILDRAPDRPLSAVQFFLIPPASD